MTDAIGISPRKELKLDDVMAEIEREYLLRALDIAKGSKQKAAELLGNHL